jgi:hypothetical protein
MLLFVPAGITLFKSKLLVYLQEHFDDFLAVVEQCVPLQHEPWFMVQQKDNAAHQARDLFVGLDGLPGSSNPDAAYSVAWICR